MTRTGERATVTGEAVPGVTLPLSAGRGYHGTALSQIAEALELRIQGVYNHTQSEHGLLTAPAPGRRSPPRQPCWVRD
jgi:AcrR family transcriptional regulator